MDKKYNLQNLKSLQRELLIEEYKLNIDIREAILNWIKGLTNIKVDVNRVNLRSYYDENINVYLPNATISILDNHNKPVFGADFTFTWYKDTVKVNSPTIGEFTILGKEREYDKYFILKYKLLSLSIEHADELNDILKGFNMQSIIDLYKIDMQIAKIEYSW